jgi:hypothetical protein
MLHNVLHADDTPHAIAMGVAIAMVVAFLPLVGFQTAIAIGVAALFHANKAVCIPIVWITNPFTIGPIYGGCWALGRLILSSPVHSDSAEILSQFQQAQDAVRIFDLEFWKTLFTVMVSRGKELWLGCAIVGVTAAVISYFLSRQGVTAYRERRRQKLLRRELFRSKRAGSKITRRSEPA